MNAILEQINSMGKGFVEFAFPMLVQSSVLIVILLLVDLVVRNRVRAVFRYCIWMLVLAKLVLPSSLSSPLSFGYLFGDSLENVTVSSTRTTAETGQMSQPMEMPRQGEARFVEAISAAPIVTPTTEGIEPAVEAAGLPVVSMGQVTWQGVVFLVWLVVVGAMVLLLLQRALFVRGLVAQAKNANSLMNDAFKYCCGQIGMKSEVGLKVSANATSPAVCGLFRPVILVPQNLGPSLGPSHLRAVLLHELAHIKRRDLWVNLVQTVLQIIYFYNPLLWLANSIIRKVREQAVDETVQVAMGKRAQQYPETLVNVAKLAFKRPALSLRLIGVVESKSALKGRIKHLLNRPIPKSAKLGILGLIVVLIIGAILLPMATSAAGRPEFIIKGTVTDAGTGQPIAGAKVGDVDKYADGRQWTITDSNGNYSYLTWYEEHGIEAEVPGYKIQHKGLYTKLFGSEKEKVLDFQLTPEDVSGQSQFKATLSSGVTVELVGVCEYPSEGKQWWRPDGTVLPEDIHVKKGGTVVARGKAFAFAMKVEGPEDMTFTWGEIEGSRGTADLEVVDSEGQAIGDMEALKVHIDETRTTTSMRIGVAPGDWMTVAEHNGKDIMSTGFPQGGIAFSQAYESDRGVKITVSDDLGKINHRIAAVDGEGNILQAVSGPWVGAGKIRQTTANFEGLSLEQIKEFQFQTRPYEWFEFKNVSLRPGVKTDVEVEKPGAKWFGELLKKAVTVNVDHGPDNDRLSVQYAVIAVCEAARVPYKREKSARLADPERRRFIESVHVKRVTGAKALEDILKPVGLRYGLDDDGLYIYRSTDSHKLGEKTATEKEGKGREGEILAKLRALSGQRNRVQRDLAAAELALQDVRVASGFTDLEERSYRHPITERLMRLEQERDNCHLEIAQLKANIENLLKQPDSPEGKEKLKKVKDNLTVLEGKLEALDKMVQEAKVRKRDLDLARVQYKRRARIRDERQVMLDSLKAQIEKLRIVYDEAERAKVGG